MDNNILNLEILQKALSYNPETGELCRRSADGNLTPCGSYRKDGYLRVQVIGKRWRVHRLGFLLAYGWLPPMVDHINGNRFDNRIQNLRASNGQHNSQNRRFVNKNNKTGFLGVSPSKNGKFESFLCVDGKNKRLGTFNTPEEAHNRYLEQKRLHHPGCTL
jgi:hypothetical protein